MASEAVVARLATNPLILRAGSLLGPYMRPNNITRLLRGDAAPLTLTADSSFHCVGYADVAAVIDHALATGLTGTFNAALCPAVTLEEIAARFGRTPVFGAFRYDAPRVSNEQLCRVVSAFRRSSLSAIETFAASLQTSAAATPHGR